MINFNTENFEFKTYTGEGLEVVALVELLTDRSVSGYLDNIDERLENSNDNDILNNAYLVKNKDGKIIGYVNLFKKENILEEHYALLKSERGKGLAKSIVLELSDEILRRRQDVDEILLKIHIGNLESKNVAINSGFKKISTDGEYNIFSRKR